MPELHVDTDSPLKRAARHKLQGMRAQDMRAILSVAHASQCVIMVRAVNPGTAELIDQGHPTKNLHIKGKSSDWGPMRHLIAVDQSLSKLAGKPGEVIAKYNKLVSDSLGALYAVLGRSTLDDAQLAYMVAEKKCQIEAELIDENGIVQRKVLFLEGERIVGRVTLQQHEEAGFWYDPSVHALAEDLVLSEQRFQSLQDSGHIEVVGGGSKNGELRVASADSAGQVHTFWLRPQSSGYAVFQEDEQTPVRVLNGVDVNKPLVADYDLHAVIPPIKKYGVKDCLPFPRINLQLSRRRLVAHRRSKQPISAEVAIKAFDQHMGNISPREVGIVKLLNKKIGRGKGLDTFHHGADSANPWAELDASFPITAFFPKGIDDFPAVMMIEDRQHLKDVMQRLANQGFVMRHNKCFGAPIAGVRPQSFKHARNELLHSPVLFRRKLSFNQSDLSSDESPRQPNASKKAHHSFVMN